MVGASCLKTFHQKKTIKLGKIQLYEQILSLVDCICIETREGIYCSPRDQAIFHCKYWLESQYSHSLQFQYCPSWESNIERVHSPFCISRWGYIFQYTPSSTRAIFSSMLPALLGKYSPSSTGSTFYSTLPVTAVWGINETCPVRVEILFEQKSAIFDDICP